MEETINKKRPKPVVLIILDGWGIGHPYQGNAIDLANKPFFDSLIAKYPVTTISPSGESVGLPWGENGNSEVGHLNLGAGRIVYQDLPRINRSIGDFSFYKNKILLDAVVHTKKFNSKLHLLGLVSSGGVHSSLDHLHALLVFARENKLTDVCLHAVLDGRDTPFNSGLNYIISIDRTMKEYGIGRIASISGRFYTMDRNNNWERTNKAYLALTEGKGNLTNDAAEAIEKSYKKKIYDEEFVPTVVVEDGIPVANISDNDAVIFFNFRPDRARQITKAFVSETMEKFPRTKKINNLYFATFTEYEKNLPVKVIFSPLEINNTLGDVISHAGLKQLRIAETEKYAHVTYFFNGGRETKGFGEDHVLIPSPRLESYDLKPEMSSPEVTNRVLKEIDSDKYDFILINFANADMVGHTSNIEAAIKAVEALDELLKKIVQKVLLKNGAVLLTADHGNAEAMFNMQTGDKDKEHTPNPVPFIVVANEFEGKNIGGSDVPGHDLSLIQPTGLLADVAPTVLKLMNLEKPDDMTGRALI